MSLKTFGEIETHQDAVEIANEMNRLKAVIDRLKNNLEEYVKNYGAVESGDQVWDFHPKETWKVIDMDGLVTMIELDDKDPYDYLTISKPKLQKLKWDKSFLSQYVNMTVTTQFRALKKKK